MSNDPLDYQQIRTLTEQRLAPILRLRQRRMWLFIHIVAFAVLNMLLYSNAMFPDPVFYDSHPVTWTNLDGSLETTIYHSPYSLVVIISALWLIAIIGFVINVTAAFRREGFIQREMKDDLELERLRMMASLARGGSGESGYIDSPEMGEKRKRNLSLGDDGELIAEEADRPRRGANGRGG